MASRIFGNCARFRVASQSEFDRITALLLHYEVHQKSKRGLGIGNEVVVDEVDGARVSPRENGIQFCCDL